MLRKCAYHLLHLNENAEKTGWLVLSTYFTINSKQLKVASLYEKKIEIEIQ